MPISPDDDAMYFVIGGRQIDPSIYRTKLGTGGKKGGLKMADINDVRKALFEAYKKKAQSEYGIEGKSGEGWCEVLYPTFWDCETIDEFLEPCGIMVYSYALGPSRQHYFKYAKKEKREDCDTWYAPDFFAKAVEVINSWVEYV